jgi:hypothetical protein
LKLTVPLGLLFFAAVKPISGQVPIRTEGVVGILPPSEIPTAPVDDDDLKRFLSSVEVLAEDYLAYHSVRVLASWGPNAGLDSGALSSHVYVALNADGFAFAAYRVGPVLDPEVRLVTTESDELVVYLQYGLHTARQCACIRVDLEGIAVSPASEEPCPVEQSPDVQGSHWEKGVLPDPSA